MRLKAILVSVVLILAACASSSVEKVGTSAYAPLPESADVVVFTELSQIRQPYEAVLNSHDSKGNQMELL